MTINIGAMHATVIVLQPATQTPDSDGGYTETSLHAEPPEMRAEIVSASASNMEGIVAHTVQSTTTHIIRMHYRPDITTRSQLQQGDRLFHVTGVTSSQRNHETVVACVEVVE